MVDDELVRRAAEVLGTRGLKATVDRSLEEVVAAATRQRFLTRLIEMRGLELNDEEVMASAWR